MPTTLRGNRKRRILSIAGVSAAARACRAESYFCAQRLPQFAMDDVGSWTIAKELNGRYRGAKLPFSGQKTFG